MKSSISNNEDYGVDDFVKIQLEFEKKYSHKFDKFSLIAYKSIFHFCLDHSFFDFQNFFNMDGSVNVDVKMLHYSDYRLIPLE